MYFLKTTTHKILRLLFFSVFRKYPFIVCLVSEFSIICCSYIRIPDRKINNYTINQPIAQIVISKKDAFCKAAHLDDLGNQKDKTGYISINMYVPFSLYQFRKRLYLLSRVFLCKAFPFEDFSPPLYKDLMKLNNEKVILPAKLGNRVIFGNACIGYLGKLINCKCFSDFNSAIGFGLLYFYNFEFVNNFNLSSNSTQKKSDFTLSYRKYEQFSNLQLFGNLLTDFFYVDWVGCLNKERKSFDKDGKDTENSSFSFVLIHNFIGDIWLPCFNFISLKIDYFSSSDCHNKMYNNEITPEMIKYLSLTHELSKYIIAKKFLGGLSIKWKFFEFVIFKNMYMSAYNKSLNKDDNGYYESFPNCHKWLVWALYSWSFSIKFQSTDKGLLSNEPLSSCYSFKSRLYDGIQPIILTSGNKFYHS